MDANRTPYRGLGPAEPPEPAETQWIVTFGGDHVLRSGEIQLGTADTGGLPLGKFFVAVRAATREEARAKVIDVFGPGNWCDVYPKDRGWGIIRRFGLLPLFSVPAQGVFGEVPVCGCGSPEHVHGRGWHADQEG